MSKKAPIKKAVLKLLSEKPAFALSDLKNEAKKAILDLKSEVSRPEYAITRTIKELVDTGEAEHLTSDTQTYIRLTKSGRSKLNTMSLDPSGAVIPTAWDGYWRVIILNLPEDRKNEREALRYLLKKAGFVCIKNTVWVSPYPFEHLFMNIKKDLALEDEIMIILTDHIDTSTEKIFTDSFKM